MYCKKCEAGHLNTYATAGAAPLFCSVCNRSLLSVSEEEFVDTEHEEEKGGCMYLQLQDEKIYIQERIVVGRNSVGKEVLKDYPDVSREHFVIEARTSGIAATITDKSSYGTYINGERIEKDVPRRVTSGAIIRLASSIEIKFIIERD